MSTQSPIQRVRGFFLEGKAAGAWSWPLTSTQRGGLRMSGSVPPLSLYAFMARKGMTYVSLYETERCAVCFMDHFHFVCGCLPRAAAECQWVIFNNKCVAISTNIVVRVLSTVYPFLVNVTYIHFLEIPSHFFFASVYSWCQNLTSAVTGKLCSFRCLKMQTPSCLFLAEKSDYSLYHAFLSANWK